MDRKKSIIKCPSCEEGDIHYRDKHVTLSEFVFGLMEMPDGTYEEVKSFVWRNHNKIEVKVITYGARIASLKVPNRLGIPEDIVLGFNDVNSYIYYQDLYMGATIGRTSNKIRNGTFAVDKKQYWLTKNSNSDHYNGGYIDFSKVNWTPYVFENKLLLSYTSPDGEEGYNGDLMVKILFELTSCSEFKINITATSTKITPVDITNMMYFNLAGHEAGPDELKNHVILMNANCFTPMVDGLPTGEIMNVVHTRNDFQTPKTLSKIMGLDFDNGYDQNFCVNRGVDQGQAFVARVTHPPSGRILEIYSNQRGVNFYTANRFSSGEVNIPVEPSDVSPKNSQEGIFLIIKKLQEYIRDNNLYEDDGFDYEAAIRTLISKLNTSGSQIYKEESFEDQTMSVHSHKEFDWNAILKPLEWQMLTAIKNAIPLVTTDMDFLQIQQIIMDLLNSETSPMGDADSQFEGSDYLKEIISRQVLNKEMSEKEIRSSTLDVSKSSSTKKTSSLSVPDYFKDGRIHGKNNVIYKRFGAMCLQTQNYPNSVYHKNFPNSILKPNETYTHTITYKFWVQSGNPNRWKRRMDMEKTVC